MGIDNFGDSDDDPNHERAKVHLEKEWPRYHWNYVEQILDWMEVLGGNTNIGFEFMMLLMYILVHQPMMKASMNPIKKKIFDEKRDENMFRHRS